MEQKSVVVTQPGHVGAPHMPQNVRSWSTGLCGCGSDCKSCCCAICCLPCMLCSLATRMDENCCLPFCCGPPGIAAMRTKLRTMHGIEGSICGDLCATGLCGLCVACQLSREMDHVGM